MCAERYLKSLPCLRVLRLSNYQMCPQVLGSQVRFISEILCLCPPLSFHCLTVNPFWLRQLSPGKLFLFARKPLKSNPKRETIPLYVHDKGLTLKATGDIKQELSYAGERKAHGHCLGIKSPIVPYRLDCYMAYIGKYRLISTVTNFSKCPGTFELDSS